MALFCAPELLVKSDPSPTEVLLFPVVFEKSAWFPNAEFPTPVVLFLRAWYPTAVWKETPVDE